jgi:hypothetical protein
VAKVISQRKLDSLRREWQKRLRLQDWKITSKFAPLGFLKEVTGTENPVGANESFVEAKEAKIHILRPEDWDKEYNERQQDVEDTVVHELLHCHFAVFDAEDNATRLRQEQVIESLTEAFMGLKRGK